MNRSHLLWRSELDTGEAMGGRGLWPELSSQTGASTGIFLRRQNKQVKGMKGGSRQIINMVKSGGDSEEQAEAPFLK